jgi:EAL domain-containing protein (putative c-di-GMP-specific phosphodiesterase class I)
VHYQPKVPFRVESSVYGVEALCRIQHPELGMIFPDNFIPLAEAHGLILELTDAVTVQAFRDQKAWDEQGTLLRMAINISPRLMGDMAWFELFERRCQEHQVDPTRVTLEVTESSSQGGKLLALEILSRLRLKGFLLSIDDFGTGFSSMETLYKLPFGELKIDKGFVLDFHKSPEARTLVETTASLAHKLGLKICAEGVETEELFHELRKLQCDDAQGYFISKPIAADKILPFFSQWEIDKQRLSAASSPNKLQVIHGLLAEILSAPDDGDDETIVLSAGAVSRSGQESASDITARIPALVMAGDMLGALAQVHRAMRSDGIAPSLSRKLLSLQAEIEGSLAVKSATLVSPSNTVELVAAASVTIGRESSSSKGDISIPCRWLSRASKNLRLHVENSGWHISDLGSTNGHFIGDKRLAPNEPVALAAGETLVEVGKTGTGPAPAWLRFQVNPDGSVQLNFGLGSDADETGTSVSGRQWIVFDRALTVGGTAMAGLAAGDGPDAVADISMRESGLWIAPRAGQVIVLGGHEFSQAIPLATGFALQLGSGSWSVEAGGLPPAPDESVHLASACA